MMGMSTQRISALHYKAKVRRAFLVFLPVWSAQGCLLALSYHVSKTSPSHSITILLLQKVQIGF